ERVEDVLSHRGAMEEHWGEVLADPALVRHNVGDRSYRRENICRRDEPFDAHTALRWCLDEERDVQYRLVELVAVMMALMSLSERFSVVCGEHHDVLLG